MITFPGLMIFLLVMGFILLGDTIRDVVSRDIQ
jgi:ABC-type dipeptide/oligopeptide/nickel transport system permease subunit